MLIHSEVQLLNEYACLESTTPSSDILSNRFEDYPQMVGQEKPFARFSTS